MDIASEILPLLKMLVMPPDFQEIRGAALGEIARAESRMDIAFPPTLKAWLHACNGTVFGPAFASREQGMIATGVRVCGRVDR